MHQPGSTSQVSRAGLQGETPLRNLEGAASLPPPHHIVPQPPEARGETLINYLIIGKPGSCDLLRCCGSTKTGGEGDLKSGSVLFKPKPGLSSAELTAALDDLKGFFQPELFHGSLNHPCVLPHRRQHNSTRQLWGEEPSQLPGGIILLPSAVGVKQMWGFL